MAKKHPIKQADPKLKARPGPKPDVYKIDGNWEDAVKKSFTKKKPAQGWPK